MRPSPDRQAHAATQTRTSGIPAKLGDPRSDRARAGASVQKPAAVHGMDHGEGCRSYCRMGPPHTRQFSPYLPEVARLARQVPDNFGRTLIEIYSGEEFIERIKHVPFTGEGVGALEEAKEQGRPVVLVTGHFGNYDAPRAALIARGYPVGGLYSPMSNAFFNDRYVAAISRIGLPVFERSGKGLGKMVRHLKAGGIVGMVADHYMRRGVPIDFMGQPAWTALSAAEMAVKYDALAIPIYGLRHADGIGFDIIVDAPIPHGEPIAMTQAMNASLERLVRAHPEQWFWIHRRWKTPPGHKQ